jgi:N-terminal acetyltransferase B complex catalytic subunit
VGEVDGIEILSLPSPPLPSPLLPSPPQYSLPYYMTYLARWSNLCVTAEGSPNSSVAGYIIGKAEGEKRNWHGHVTAVTVAPEYRRLGLAKYLMDYLERVSDEQYRGFFVDLYVRASNSVAIDMYKKLGYVAYRRVKLYYMGEEDAFGMSFCVCVCVCVFHCVSFHLFLHCPSPTFFPFISSLLFSSHLLSSLPVQTCANRCLQILIVYL